MTKMNHSFGNLHLTSPSHSHKNLRLNLLGSASLALALSLPMAALAAPQGGVVVGGMANISATGTTTNIDQSTNRAVINWNSFNVARDETVNFKVPTGGATLNRVIGGAASLIQGTVNSNGTLYLVNQNGLVFDTTSKVYAQNFIATTSNIAPDNFMAGATLRLEKSQVNAKISLKGEVQVADRGIIGLFAPVIVNEGKIAATLGQVVLAGAQTAVIDFTGDGLMNFELGESEYRKEIISAGNAGMISASGGKVILTAQGAKNMMNAAVAGTYRGVIDVSSPTQDGSVSLTVVNGTLFLSGLTVKANGSVGGNINLSADNDYSMYFSSSRSSLPFFAASQDVTIKTSGHLSLSGGVVAGRDLILSSRGLYFGQSVTTGRDIIVNSEVFTSQGSVAAGRDIVIRSNGFVSQGSIAAGRDVVIRSNDMVSQGNITAGQDVILKSWRGIVSQGNIAGGRDVIVAATVHVISQGNMAAGRDMTLISLRNIVSQGNIAAGRDVTISSDGSLVSQGNIAAGRDITASSNRGLTFQGSVVAHGNITFNEPGASYYGYGRGIHADGDIIINRVTTPIVFAAEPAPAPTPAPAPAPVTPPVAAAEPAPAPAPVTPPVAAAEPAPAPVAPPVAETPKPTPPVVVASKPAPAPVLPPKTITVNIPNATGDQVTVDTTSKANVKALDSANGSYIVSVTSTKAPVSINISVPDDKANWGNTEPDVSYDPATKLYTTKFIFGKSADGSVPDASKIKVTVNVATSAPKVVTTVINNLGHLMVVKNVSNSSGAGSGNTTSAVISASTSPTAPAPASSLTTQINQDTSSTSGVTSNLVSKAASNTQPTSGDLTVKAGDITITTNSDGGVTVVNGGWGGNSTVSTNGDGDATAVSTTLNYNRHGGYYSHGASVTIGGTSVDSTQPKPVVVVATPTHYYPIYKFGYRFYGVPAYKYRYTMPSISAGGNIIINGVTVK